MQEERPIALAAGCCVVRHIEVDRPQTSGTSSSTSSSPAGGDLENFVVTVSRGLKVRGLDRSLQGIWERALLPAAQLAGGWLDRCALRANVRVVPRLAVDGAELTAVVLAVHSQPAGREAEAVCPLSLLAVGLDAQDGRELWRYQEGHDHLPALARPADQNDKDQQTAAAGHFFLLPNSSLSADLRRLLFPGASPAALVTGASPQQLADWTAFRHSLLQQLPHHWADGRDHRLGLGHFQREHPRTATGLSPGPGPYRPQQQQQKKKATASAGQRKKNGPGRRKKKSELLARGLLPGRSSSSSSRSNGTASSSAHGQGQGHGRQRSPYNVAVYHFAHGLRVLGLANGRPLLSLPLEPAVTYGDLNRDGQLDSLRFSAVALETIEGRARVVSSPGPAEGRPAEQEADEADGQPGQGQGQEERGGDMCQFTVLSGLPPHSLLFSSAGEICDGEAAYRKYGQGRGSGQGKGKNGRKAAKESRERLEKLRRESAQAVKASALFVRPPVRAGGAAHPHHQPATAAEMLGIELADPFQAATTEPPLSPREVALVVGTNLGLLTAFNGQGRVLWQESDWTAVPANEREYEERLATAPPQLLQMAPTIETAAVDGLEDHLLALGPRKVRLLSLENGRVLAESDLPNPAAGHPLVVDVDGDGVHDVVVATEVALVGYRLTVVPAFYPLVLPFAVFLLIGLVVFLLKLGHESPATSSASSSSSSVDGAGSGKGRGGAGGGKGSGKGKSWSLTRATDSTHLD